MTEETGTVHPEQPVSGGQAGQLPEKFYVRFTLAQRYLHAILFTSFLGLAATGLPMRFSDNAAARHLASAVGGFGAILFFHKFCAIILTLAFLYHLKDIVTRVVVHKEKGLLWGPNSMVANWKDVQDLIGHLRWFVGLGPKPKFDRFAYWEKFDYWAVFWGMIVIGFSGYAMWFAPFAGHPVYLLDSLRQHASAPGKFSDGYGDLYGQRDGRGVREEADAGV
jgi:cytochrome b subunit of formate dehydrogenase